MGRLLIYGVFHGNLNYSYIPEDLYPQIIRRCYWPLLDMIDSMKIPFGLEFSAYSLETINRIDPAFVTRLRDMWGDGACEFVGCGYMQEIMPLIPLEVNKVNLGYGNQVYRELLGELPKVGYINEQVYSKSLPLLYHESGYRGLMINWESAVSLQSDDDLLYQPCSVSMGTQGNMPIIWQSLDAYRNFQRYVEKEIDLDDYMGRLLQHVPENGTRSYPIYTSDWEVFDFKPWKVYPDGYPNPSLGEMDRISGLMSLLNDRDDIEFISPSGLIELFPDQPLVQPETPGYPLTYKKQSLHSVTRWAVSGRENVRINTQCYQLYRKLMVANWYLDNDETKEYCLPLLEALWQDLCFLWGSDFRTFTTEEKHLNFRNRMGMALNESDRLIDELMSSEAEIITVGGLGSVRFSNRSNVYAKNELVSFPLQVDESAASESGLYEVILDEETIPCQVSGETQLRSGKSTLTLETAPVLNPGETKVGVVKAVHNHKADNRSFRIDSINHVVETRSLRLELIPECGGAIRSVKFSDVCDVPLIGIIGKSNANGIEDTMSCPQLSGDVTLQNSSRDIITDHHCAKIYYPEKDTGNDIFLPILCMVQTDLGTIWKTYRVYKELSRIDIKYRFQWRDLVPEFLRIGTVCINPQAFDISDLYYSTTNGSHETETFNLQGNEILHGNPRENGFTAQSCIGASDAWTVIGDSDKGIGLVTKPAELYSVPMVHYSEQIRSGDAFEMRLAYSLGEHDETSHTLWRGHSTWSLTILGSGSDILQRTRDCALLANGGLFAESACTSQN